MFDLILGMDRWALRVAAYAGLMTDSYPPFRFDSGADEPDVTTIEQTPLPTPGQSGWTGGRIASVFIGALLLVTGGAIAVTGGAGLWLDGTQRDTSGFISTDSRSFQGEGDALEFGTVELHWSTAEWVVADNWLGDIRLRASQDTFIGIGPAADMARYLSGVDRDEVDIAGSVVTYRHRSGGAPDDPRSQAFWAVSGTGQVSWRAEPGTWTVVVMNADGSRVVDTRVTAETTVPALRPVSIGLLIGGAALFVMGAMLLVVAAIRASR